MRLRTPQDGCPSSLLESQEDETLLGGASHPPRLNATGKATVVAVYLAFGLGFAAALARVCMSYPLFPLQTDSLEWNRTWLLTTCADYWVCCFCLCGIIVSSEPALPALLWVLGCNLLGSPVCCLYVAHRALRAGSLQLVAPREKAEP